MIHKRPAAKFQVKSVHMGSQSDHDRLAMMMMQLDIALTLARENEMRQVEQYLQMARDKTRLALEQHLN